MTSRERRLVKKHMTVPKVTGDIAGNLILPNNSGDHQKSIKRNTPLNDVDIVNKKYVDDQIATVGAHTESSTDSLTNKTINSSTNDVHADSIHELLRNETGLTINKGDAVFISGYNVGLERALVTLANSSSSATMPCVALVEDDTITNNATGEFVEAGTLMDVNTSSWSVGDPLWISETGTTGNTLTNTKPTGTTDIQKVGEVLRSHATRGIIEVFGAGRVNDLPNVATHTMSMGSNKITSVTDPTTNQDAATKKYVDDNSGAGDVTAGANLTNETIVQGDGGAKGVKTSTLAVDDVATKIYSTTQVNTHTALTATHGVGEVADAGDRVVTKVLIDTYTGTDANSRELDLGDDYDEIHIYLERDIDYDSNHLVEAYAIRTTYGVYGTEAGSTWGILHRNGSTGNPWFQGKMTGGDVNKIKLGSTGSETRGTNKNGWTYRIIAKKYANVETIPA